MASSADVARMQAILDHLRREYDITIREVPGWQTRGATWSRTPAGLVVHHDASSRKAGEWGALGIITYGRDGIPPPLAQFQIGRCADNMPRLAVVAAGRANHAGRGGPYRFPDGLTIPADSANAWLFGTEAANDGVGEPYTAAAHYTRDALARTLLDVLDLPLGRIIGHREWAPGRKSDPAFDCDWMRAGAAGIRPATTAAQTGPSPTLDEDLMLPIPIRYGTQHTDNPDLFDEDPAGLDFRGVVDAESGDFSAVIDAMWVRWSAKWGGAQWRIVFWGATGPIWEVPADVLTGSDNYPVPAACRSFTVEGTRAHRGVQVSASLITRPKR